MIKKIISGGQTGVDRAALDVAIKLNIPHGGWCPKGRKAEDGALAERYHLTETESDDYSERTKANIRDSTGTLIIVPSLPLQVTDGTLLTIAYAKEINKPHYICNLSQSNASSKALALWLTENQITILNIAGPRESQVPGIYQMAFQLHEALFQAYFEEKRTVTSKL